MSSLASILLVFQVASGGAESEPPLADFPLGDSQQSQLPWEHLDTLAVLGSGPDWSEPPFYQVFDAVLDNDRNVVFLANGGDGELIIYDIGSGQIDRIGRRGRGPGEFGRPLWMEPYGADSLLVYDLNLIRFSVFSRSGRFGRTFRARGTGLGGKQAAAVARMGTETWVGVQSGTPRVLMGIDTPPGTMERDTLTVYAIDDEGNALDTIARVPHGLWERLPDTTSFNVRRDEEAGGAAIAGGGGSAVRRRLGRFAGSVCVSCRWRPGCAVAIAGCGSGHAAAGRESGLCKSRRIAVYRRARFSGWIYGLPCVRGVIGYVVPGRNAHIPGGRSDSGCIPGQGRLPASR